MSSKNYTHRADFSRSSNNGGGDTSLIEQQQQQQMHVQMHVDTTHLGGGKGKVMKPPQLLSLMDSKASLSNKLSMSEFDSSMVVMSEPDSQQYRAAGSKAQSHVNHNSYQYPPAQAASQGSKIDSYPSKQHNMRQTGTQQNNRYNNNNNNNTQGVTAAFTGKNRFVIPDAPSSSSSSCEQLNLTAGGNSGGTRKTENTCNNYKTNKSDAVIAAVTAPEKQQQQQKQPNANSSSHGEQTCETIYSSFSNDVLNDGVIKKSLQNCRLESSQEYQGLYIQANQLQNNQKHYVWLSQQYFSKVFKFPIIKKVADHTDSPSIGAECTNQAKLGTGQSQYNNNSTNPFGNKVNKNIRRQQQQQDELTFGKCTSNIKESLNQIHAISPFKKSLQASSRSNNNNNSNPQQSPKEQQMLHQQQQMEQHEARQLTAAKKRKELATSFQSEDVMDTLEELPLEERPVNVATIILDNEIVSVNNPRSVGPHQHTSKQISKVIQKEEREAVSLSPINEDKYSARSQSPTDRDHKNNNDGSAMHLPLNQNDKVFALQIDDNIHDTSFDTIISEHLFVTQTEDHFPISAQKSNTHGSGNSGSVPVSNFNSNNNINHMALGVGGSNKSNHPHQQQQTVECVQAVGDDSMIENELKQISQNLNTFTVEHFNNLRQQIQAVGFFQAANKAKREFNLITSDSTTTLNSVKDEYNEVGRQGTTEQTRIHSKLNNMYANNTVASKNLLHVNDPRSKHSQIIEVENREVAYNVSGLSPLIRKLAICEQKRTTNPQVSQIEVLHSSSCSGFNSTPLLAYSDQEADSKAYLDKSYQASLIMNQLLSPQILESFIQTPITWITCGFENCVALTVYGILASWGYGASGCLGHNNYTSYTSPKLLVEGDLQGQFITYVESGGYHSAAISQEGQLFMWGRSDVGQVGLPKEQLLEDEMGYVALAPKHIKHFSDINRKVKQVALGEAHTVVLDEQGHVYSFGWGELGQLGISSLSQNKDNQFHINKIKFFETFPCERVSAGAVFSLALTKQKGRIYAWGSGQNGQLGLGSVKSCDFPVFVDFLQNERIIDIECGDSHALALSDKGTVYGWGQGISQSQSLIKSLRDSSMISQNNNNTINQGQQPSPNDNCQSDNDRYSGGGGMMLANPTVNQLEVICFFPRVLSEVDIAHTFLIKKKQPAVLQQIEICETQNSNIGQGLTEQVATSSQSSSSQSKNAIKRLYTNSGRNMPSNHTICEVSERDSELDERSQILKRQELKSIIMTSHGAQVKSMGHSGLNRSQNWQQNKSIKTKPKIEMVVRRSPSPRHESGALQGMTGGNAAASGVVGFGRKKSVQLPQLQSSSLQQQQQHQHQQQQYMKLDNPNRMQSTQSKVVMLVAETSEKGPIAQRAANQHSSQPTSSHQESVMKSQELASTTATTAAKNMTGKEDIIKKLQEFTQGNIFNEVHLSQTQKVVPLTGLASGIAMMSDGANQSSLNSSISILHSSASLAGVATLQQQKNANSASNNNNNCSSHININDNIFNHTSKISSNGAPLPPPSGHKTHSKQQSRLQTYSNSIIESFSAKRFKMPSDMNSSSVLGYQSNNSSRISIREGGDQNQNQHHQQQQCNRTQRIRSPQPDGSVLSKFSANKHYSSPKLDTPNANATTTTTAAAISGKYKTPLNSSSHNAAAAAYQTNNSSGAHSSSILVQNGRPAGCQTVLGKDVLKDLPSTTRNKNFQIKFSSGTNSYKKTAAGTGVAATSNTTAYNMNDTSKFSTSSNKSNMSTLISPSRKFIHKKNQSMGGGPPSASAFNESGPHHQQSVVSITATGAQTTTHQKPKGPKIGMTGSGQQSQAGAIPPPFSSSTSQGNGGFPSGSSRVSPKSGRRPLN